jgi:hypothetical protein
MTTNAATQDTAKATPKPRRSRAASQAQQDQAKATSTKGKAQADPAKAEADKARQAKAKAVRASKLDAAAQARVAKLPEDKRQALLAQVPDGYQVIWPKGAWATLKLVSDQAPEGSPVWMILCTAHGTTKALPGSRAAEAEGTRAGRAAWCRKCKAAQA